jgi:hypothetical protein
VRKGKNFGQVVKIVDNLCRVPDCVDTYLRIEGFVVWINGA